MCPPPSAFLVPDMGTSVHPSMYMPSDATSHDLQVGRTPPPPQEKRRKDRIGGYKGAAGLKEEEGTMQNMEQLQPTTLLHTSSSTRSLPLRSTSEGKWAAVGGHSCQPLAWSDHLRQLLGCLAPALRTCSATPFIGHHCPCQKRGQRRQWQKRKGFSGACCFSHYASSAESSCENGPMIAHTIRVPEQGNAGRGNDAEECFMCKTRNDIWTG